MAAFVVAMLLLLQVRAEPVMRRSSVTESKRQPLMRSQKETKDAKVESTPPAQRSRQPIFTSLEETQPQAELDDCGLAPWSSWSICTKCGGRRVRTREALGVLAEYTSSDAPESKHRSDMKINFRSGDGHVRWSGQLLVKNAGRYAFRAEETLRSLQIGAALRAQNTSDGEWVRWLAKGAHSLQVEAEADQPIAGAKQLLQYRGPDTEGKLQEISTAALRHAVLGGVCQSRSVQSQPCPACSVDCAWGDWADWSACSRTCGHGSSERLRSVATRASQAGRACEGSSSEQQSCHLSACSFW
ncbi:HMCN1 [Symbiodinium pilosum]|uniref:HMCN1 protein n=1 Tax=Symbiodinium pilosum TaxID=2952 RepID=A0A812YKU8_SYMPI|nr:HMCN1 [Symbiodinium pilosum]